MQIELPVKYAALKPYEKRKVRETYIVLQNGLCHYCGETLDKPAQETRKITPRLYPPGFFDHPVHLHHDHVTGLTIGAVHCYCNAVLWEYHGE